SRSVSVAALWKLAVVSVIERIEYGMGVSVERASARADLHRRGGGFGIPGQQVDGMDVIAVAAAGAKAVAAARAGQGPQIIEMMTYRYRGHSMSDPGKYRSREEIAKVRQESDPIDRLRAQLIAGGHTDEAALKGIDKAIRDVVSAATEFAQNSPEPNPAELYTDVLVEA